MKHIHFKTIDSTHNYLSKNYQDFDQMTLISTDHQTSGIGRLDRQWYGDQDSIMCSLLLKDHLDEMKISLIPLCAAMSVHQVLSTYHQDIMIKWPNDLWIHGLKLSGILVKSMIESQKVLAVIVSFGININQESFPDDIKDIATSLKKETHETYDKDTIMRHVISQFLRDLEYLKTDSTYVIDYCNNYAALSGHVVTFLRDKTSDQGIVKHINDDGHLVVQCQKETIILHSGEVVLYHT
jgi:BirA family biotin operon repressor/biotin-[acetyl-CoA-carboxylase] ligase